MVSTVPWSNYSEADYSLQQWHNACLIHLHDGPPTSKTQCKLPVKTPGGVVNKNGVYAAAAALAGARSALKAPIEQKAMAARKLISYYQQFNAKPPQSLFALGHSMDVGAFLEHHGIKGMKWGIRNDLKPSGFRFQTIEPVVDSSLNSSTKTSGKQVSKLMAQRYGFQITEIKNLKTKRPDEYNRGTVAFVENTPGKSGGIIYAKPENITKELQKPANAGWMAKGTDNIRGLLTHESAHALFHAQQSTKSGFFAVKVVGGEQSARDKAMKAAVKQAKKDGISSDFLSKISGYAAYSGTREEAEAEMFSQYHWANNPPNFVKVWGQTLHQEMGVDSTPFKEEVKRG